MKSAKLTATDVVSFARSAKALESVFLKHGMMANDGMVREPERGYIAVVVLSADTSSPDLVLVARNAKAMRPSLLLNRNSTIIGTSVSRR